MSGWLLHTACIVFASAFITGITWLSLNQKPIKSWTFFASQIVSNFEIRASSITSFKSDFALSQLQVRTLNQDSISWSADVIVNTLFAKLTIDATDKAHLIIHHNLPNVHHIHEILLSVFLTASSRSFKLAFAWATSMIAFAYSSLFQFLRALSFAFSSSASFLFASSTSMIAFIYILSWRDVTFSRSFLSFSRLHSSALNHTRERNIAI